MKNHSTQKLTTGDLEPAKQLLVLFEHVLEDNKVTFDDLPPDDYLLGLLAKPDFYMFAAFEGDKVIGGLTAYELNMYLEPERELYLYHLAVDFAYHRQGVATALLDELRKYAKTRGVTTFFLDTEADDTRAVSFYKAVGGKPLKAVCFEFKI